MDVKKIIKEEILREGAGISQIVRQWVDVILEELKDQKGEEQVVIEGKKYPELYDKFSVDYWVFNQLESRMEYDHMDSGYDEDGNYVAIFNLPLNRVDKRVLVHEVKHSYDDWNRMKNNGSPIRDSWEVSNIYTGDFERLITGEIKHFPILGPVIKLYYFASKLETPAFLENELDSPGMYMTYGKKLRDFNTDRFYRKGGKLIRNLEREFDNLQQYHIPLLNKFTDVRDFLEHTKKYFNKRGKEITRKIDKMHYRHRK